MALAPNDSFFTYRTEYGPISICAKDDKIIRVALGRLRSTGEERPSATTNECATQLMEYFAGKRTIFDIPLLLQGTDFQKRAWERMLEIPYAQTCTATEIAELLGSPGASSAVGAAVRHNPLVVLVPAHRVVAASGRVEPNDRSARLRKAFRELERRFS